MLNQADAFPHSSQLTSFQQTRLLVSVTSASEAAVAREHGADWIDVKNPRSGSLGAPPPSVALETLDVLAGFARTSIALGELRDVEQIEPQQLVASRSERFPIAKVGLAGLANSSDDWSSCYHRLARCIAPTRLVPVLYADGSRCSAANRDAVVALIQTAPPPFLLIDTFFKDGQRLLDWFSLDQLRSIQAELEPLGTSLVLAGSLQLSDLPDLLELSPAAIAVRGAVCIGDRTAALSDELVRRWSYQVQSLAVNARGVRPIANGYQRIEGDDE